MSETVETEPELRRAPWTEAEVHSLNGYQQAGSMHPFTCGYEHPGGHVVLIATPSGWRCPKSECDYTQDWAWPWMANGEWARSALVRQEAGIAFGVDVREYLPRPNHPPDARPAEETDVSELILPETMTPAIEDALGLMNFRTGPIAHRFRAAGHQIERKCEAEQAFVLFWALRLAIQHGITGALWLLTS